MTIAPGTRLGPYELDSRIGAGGMGEVWRARDTRLDRSVAIKMLPVGFAADPHSKTRFEREARTISQLEHPNICRLYDVGEAQGETDAPVPYLVTELLDGETLRAKLGDPANGHRRLSVRKALDYAAQLGDGLAAAHDRGIVHRDLKPENIFITREGRVKVLDFGIAKSTAPALAGTTAETAAGDTSPGTVLGTVAYMSRIAFSTEPVALNPRSRTSPVPLWTADARSGATRQVTKALDAVQPSWSPHGHRIAFWGIRGDGAQRDLWTINPDAADPDASAVGVTNDAAIDWNPFWSADGTWLYFASDRGGSMNLWRVAIDERTGVTRGALEPVTLAAAFAAHFSAARQANTIIFSGVLSSNAIERLALDVPGDRPVPVFNGSLPITAFDVSPDGGRIAFGAVNGSHEDLFVMNSDGSHIEQLTDEQPDRGPVWSSDGTSLYFYSQRNDRYETYTMRPDGGGLTQITRSSGPGLAFPRPSPDGSLLVAMTSDGSLLWDVRASRAQPLPPPAADRVTSDPRWSPDGRRVAAFENPAGNLNRTLGIVIYDVDARTYRQVANDPAYALTWLTDKAIAFAASGALTVLDLPNATRREIKLPSPAAGPRSLSASLDVSSSTFGRRALTVTCGWRRCHVDSAFLGDALDSGAARIMLWDGKSKGTVNNVVNLSRDSKPVVVYVAPI